MSALAAVLQRDFRGSERTGLLHWARVIAFAGCGLLALTALSSFGPATDADIPHGCAVLIGALMALSLIFAASFALGAFRAERRSGALDLLLLTGLRPRTLALGRVLSSFLVLQSLAVAALPALALFWFFRTPSPRAWLLFAIVLTSWNAALAAGGVALSAWTRRPGPALAGSLILLPAFAALSLTEGARLSWSAPGLLWQALVSEGEVDAARASLTLGFHGALLAVGVVVAQLGLQHERPDAAFSEARPAPPRKPLSEVRPLTWLLHRNSAASRPGVQLLAMTGGLALLSAGALAAPLSGAEPIDIFHPKALSAVGGSLALLSIGLALAVGASRIAGEREQGTWDTIVSSGCVSERLFLDLLDSTLRCCLVPSLLASAVLMSAELIRGVSFLPALAAPASVFASVFLGAVLGLAASACARNTAVAVALACLLALGVPTLVASSRLLPSQFSAQGGGSARFGFALVFFMLAGLPLLIRGIGPWLLWAVARLREGRVQRPGPGSLLLVPLFVLLPLAGLSAATSGKLDESWALAFGGGHAALISLVTLGEERSALKPALLASGAAWQALFALLVLGSLWSRRDLWLGRAGK